MFSFCFNYIENVVVKKYITFFTKTRFVEKMLNKFYIPKYCENYYVSKKMFRATTRSRAHVVLENARGDPDSLSFPKR